MESPRRPRPRQKVWYFFSDDVPEHELIVPVKSKYGLAFAVRPGAGMEQAMLDELNRTADWVLGIGLAHLESQEAETAPEREE